MKKFSSIEQFRNVHKLVKFWASKYFKPMPTMKFRGTVKLHGTNAGVRRTVSSSGEVKFICQSRNEVKESGHYGFSEHIKSIGEDILNDIFTGQFGHISHESTLYGEWIGQGIQSGVAISNLAKSWVLFGAALDENYVELSSDVKCEQHNIYNIQDGPVYELDIDFDKPENAMAEMERLTLEIEAECPWAKRFGVFGIGEGIVWKSAERPNDSDLWFKTKGPKHSVTKTRTVASVDPVEVKAIRELVDNLMTENRMNQGFEHLREKDLDTEIKNIGLYLKYLGRELQREEGDTIEASGFAWKKVWKVAGAKAKDRYIKETNKF